MIWYVHRRQGVIASAHEANADGSCPMPGYCDEGLDDATNPEIQAYRADVTVIPEKPATNAQLTAQIDGMAATIQALSDQVEAAKPQETLNAHQN